MGIRLLCTKANELRLVDYRDGISLAIGLDTRDKPRLKLQSLDLKLELNWIKSKERFVVFSLSLFGSGRIKLKGERIASRVINNKQRFWLSHHPLRFSYRL